MSISSKYEIKQCFSSGSLKSISRNPRLFYVSSTTSTTSDTTWCHHLKRLLNVDSFQKGATLHRQVGLARGSVAIWWPMIREGDNSCFMFLRRGKNQTQSVLLWVSFPRENSQNVAFFLSGKTDSYMIIVQPICEEAENRERSNCKRRGGHRA